MEYLMYGFEADIRKYDMGDILGWILMISLLHLVAGNFIAKRRVGKEYMKLIRLGCFSKWWRRLCIRVLGLSLGLTAVVFVLSFLVQTVMWGLALQEVLRVEMLRALCLFFLNISFFCGMQTVLVNLGQWEKLSFLIVTVVDILSLYGRSIGERAAYWLPGSWKMYARSSWFLEEGYLVAVTSVIQVVLLALWFGMGCRLLKRE